MLGAVLSTVNVALGPAAEAALPARSVAVPVRDRVPSAPSPVMPESVTVQVRAGPLPLTLSVEALAVPVLFSVRFARGQRAGVEVRIGIGHGVADRIARRSDRVAEGAPMRY